MSKAKETVLAFNTQFVFTKIDEEDMFNEDGNYNADVPALALKVITSYVSDLEAGLGVHIADKILISVEKDIHNLKEGIDKNQIDYEDSYIYVLLKKVISSDTLNNSFLKMDNHIIALFPNDEGQIVKQSYDDGEYDTGYFSHGPDESYIEHESFNMESYYKAKEILLNQ